MAKISQLRTNTALPRSLLLESGTLPQLNGSEGRELTRRLAEVAQANQKDEPIQRLLKSLEKVSDKHHQDLRLYLDSLHSEAKFTRKFEFTGLVIDIAWQVWERLRSHFQLIGLCLEVPDACPGERNNFMYTWSKGEHYFECEIFGGGEVEFFYRNRNSNEVWGEDTTREQEFSTTVLDKAALFAW